MSERIAASTQKSTLTTAPLTSTIVLQRAAISTLTPVHSGVLQRCSGGVECAECREKREKSEGMLQRAAVSATPTTGAPPIVHEVLSSSGQPLDAGTRAFMEPRFGHDFSQVRVHTDDRAAESARAVNALAYTVGRDVVFGTGRYMPTTTEGKRLLAHELTHVVQQASNISMSGGIGSRGDPHEREAERVASIVSMGQSTNVRPRASSPLLQCREEDFRLQEPTLRLPPRPQPGLLPPGEELQLHLPSPYPCPTRTEVEGLIDLTREGLASGYRTAYGAIAVMHVRPDMRTWDGTPIFELVTTGPNGCPEGLTLSPCGSSRKPVHVGSQQHEHIHGDLPTAMCRKIDRSSRR